jgi:hypothetical protein
MAAGTNHARGRRPGGREGGREGDPAGLAGGQISAGRRLGEREEDWFGAADADPTVHRSPRSMRRRGERAAGVAPPCGPGGDGDQRSSARALQR